MYHLHKSNVIYQENLLYISRVQRELLLEEKAQATDKPFEKSFNQQIAQKKGSLV